MITDTIRLSEAGDLADGAAKPTLRELPTKLARLFCSYTNSSSLAVCGLPSYRPTVSIAEYPKSCDPRHRTFNLAYCQEFLPVAHLRRSRPRCLENNRKDCRDARRK